MFISALIDPIERNVGHNVIQQQQQQTFHDKEMEEIKKKKSTLFTSSINSVNSERMKNSANCLYTQWMERDEYICELYLFRLLCATIRCYNELKCILNTIVSLLTLTTNNSRSRNYPLSVLVC